MKSLEGMSQHPTHKEVMENLDRIEEKTVGEEFEAKRLGLSNEEYERKNKKETFSPKPFSVAVEDKVEIPEIKKLIERWEKENNGEGQAEYEQLPVDTEITNKTPYQMSNFFVSNIVRLAREQISYEHSKKYDKNILDNLSNVFSVQIKEVKGTDGLQFDIYINKRSLLFKKNTEMVILTMYPNGTLKL